MRGFVSETKSLNALAACVYMATMGKQGLRDVAELCYQKAHYAASEIAKLDGYRVVTGDSANRSEFFNEFVIECPRPVSEINHALYEKGIIGGDDSMTDRPLDILPCLFIMSDGAGRFSFVAFA